MIDIIVSSCNYFYSMERVMFSIAFTLGRVTQYILTDPLVRKILISVLVIILNSKK